MEYFKILDNLAKDGPLKFLLYLRSEKNGDEYKSIERIKAIVDKTRIETLDEFVTYPQATAFRNVVLRRPQYKLFVSHLRSNGFDVSISSYEGKENDPYLWSKI